eukprot:CAMPEP_0114245412 /NCGR_PEP_ID=MMETSP0058-20121206/11880_1 /TAXON_ID=36894 /ORGANISM="Pyramimonas parkeae, CCMP726" /LENGTH=110 /DNA_ID=CAMNT_0001358459 /DNA_START=110 /DNA_END=442 /DNA_ORIENTATION=+
MAAIAALSAPVCVKGLNALPAKSKAQKAVAPRAVRKLCVASAKRSMAVAAAPAASALVAMQANAAEIMAAQPQEIAQIADITPVFYVGFLVASLGFTLTTYIVLNKIKLI